MGLWIVVSPFVLGGEIASGTAMGSNLVARIAIVVLAGYVGYSLRSSSEFMDVGAEAGGWIAALAGIWLAIAPFVLSGSIADGVPMWGNISGGLLAPILGAYAGYAFRSRH